MKRFALGAVVGWLAGLATVAGFFWWHTRRMDGADMRDRPPQ